MGNGRKSRQKIPATGDPVHVRFTQTLCARCAHSIEKLVEIARNRPPPRMILCIIIDRHRVADADQHGHR